MSTTSIPLFMLWAIVVACASKIRYRCETARVAQHPAGHRGTLSAFRAAKTRCRNRNLRRKHRQNTVPFHDSAMRLEDPIRGLITILFIALCPSRPGLADDLDVLHYDHPIAENLKRLDHANPRSQINARFMGGALPLGSGRFGAMFSGHVDSEYLVFNDITLWMNSTRGESEFKQSGSPADGKDYLELVRAACREEKFGEEEGSIESLGTKFLASKQELGNFAPFADLEIRTGHDPTLRMITIEPSIFRPEWET